MVKNMPANAGDAVEMTPVQLLGQGGIPGEGMATPPSILGWGNPFSLPGKTARGDWQPVVHGVAKRLDTTEQLSSFNKEFI